MRFHSNKTADLSVKGSHGRPLLGVLPPARHHDSVHVGRAAVGAAEHLAPGDLSYHLWETKKKVSMKKAGLMLGLNTNARV